MFARKVTASATTDASGNATVYSEAVTGEIHSIAYTKTDFAAGVDFAVTLEGTGEVLWTGTDVNASAVVYPVVAATVAGTGVASALLQVPIIAANDRVKFVVSSGGNTKTGAFSVTVT
jgi:hypothetical protein